MGPFTEISSNPVFHFLLAPDNSLELYAALISAAAAAFSAIAAGGAWLIAHKQIVMQKEYSERSAKPKLVTYTGISTDGVFEIDIKNIGTGPAIIKNVEITLDGNPLSGEGQSLMHSAITEIFPNRAIEHVFLPYKEDYIDAKNSIALLIMPLRPRETEDDIRETLGTRLKTVITYESIYGKTYTHNPSREE